ncbi:MAG: Hsp20/alpha crystallin family protein [Desulfovibrionaceae bacterium]|jgi:HSP20 family protein|nr:Hsp20/alpha crystallin family protein [Desulfovibrionaceae bacterium]
MGDLKNWGQRELTRLRQDVDRLFEALCFDMGVPPVCREGGAGVHFEEHGGELVVTVPVPGLAAAAIDLTATPTWLAIALTREEEVGGALHRETLRKEFVLPVRVRPDAARAELKDEILTVRLPVVTPTRLTIDD